MILRLALACCVCALFSNCSLYPLGHSRMGYYYGGQGDAEAPRIFVPREVRRTEPIL